MTTLEEAVLGSRVKITVDGEVMYEADFKTLYTLAVFGTFEGPYPLLEINTADGVHVKVDITPGKPEGDAPAPVGGQVSPVREPKPRRTANRAPKAIVAKDA